MPLPTNLNSNLILNKISYKKDVDGLTDINMGRLIHNNEYLSPCTPTGIIDLLDYYNIDISSKNITIIGRSNLVGKPLFNLFINRNATVTLCHSKTLNLKEYTKNADILVVAVGIPNFITADFIKENAIVIDVGINRVDNKIVGDVNFTNVSSKTSYITPTPGGVGPMTVYELFNNTYKAYILGQNKRD
jgi:methylenetetrahydrofolate dehydrogenase (NADP+)/methenyltetrahydrofolate cyclohydrolase